MILSVVVPKVSKGMLQMLERELKGIDSEVIVSSWAKGVQKARGDFVCLLEKDSAVERNTIRDNLSVFTNNPSYRKLAMVSCGIDSPTTRFTLFPTYINGLTTHTKPSSNTVHAVRIGWVPGAIIRRSSLLKSGVTPDGNPGALSVNLSLNFWNHGLRISLNPESLYYLPEERKYPPGKAVKPTETVTTIWEREMIP